jgi:hypothetical protein
MTTTMPLKSRRVCQLIVLAVLAAACAPATTPLPTATPPTTLSPTSSPTLTRTPTPTLTQTRTPPPTQTTKPTRTPTQTPTDTPTAIPLPDIVRPVTPIDEVLPGTVERLRGSPDGALWLITDQGVAKLVNNTWEILLSDFAGELVGIDAAGRIWVVGEDGSEISVWDGGGWTVYGADAGWTPLADDPQRHVGGGQSDRQGRFWLATSQDVRVFYGERWTVFTPEDMGMEPTSHEDFAPSFGITALKSADEIWVGACIWGPIGPAGGGGVRWFDGYTWRGADSPLASDCAPEIEEDRSGYVWVGTSNVLWRYDPASGDWAQFAPDLRGAFLILDTVLDPSGDLWVSLTPCGGSCFNTSQLYRVTLPDGSWIKVAESTERDGFYLPILIFDAASTPWLFWGEAIYRIVENVPKPVAHLSTRSVTVDTSGRVWFLAQHESRDWLWTLDTETGG